MTKVLCLFNFGPEVPFLLYSLSVSVYFGHGVDVSQSAAKVKHFESPIRKWPLAFSCCNTRSSQLLKIIRGGSDIEMASGSTPMPETGLQNEQAIDLDEEIDEEEDDDLWDGIAEESKERSVFAPIDEKLMSDPLNDSWTPGRAMLRQEYTDEMHIPAGAPLFPPDTTLDGGGFEEQHRQQQEEEQQQQEQKEQQPELADPGPDDPFGFYFGPEDVPPEYEDPGPPGEEAGPDYEDLVVPDLVEGVPAAVRAAAYHSQSAGGARRRVIVRAGEHRWTEPLRLYPKWIVDIPPW
jgi:hypothetical protein